MGNVGSKVVWKGKDLDLHGPADRAARDRRKTLNAQKRNLVADALRTCQRKQPLYTANLTLETLAYQYVSLAGANLLLGIHAAAEAPQYPAEIFSIRSLARMSHFPYVKQSKQPRAHVVPFMSKGCVPGWQSLSRIVSFAMLECIQVGTPSFQVQHFRAQNC